MSETLREVNATGQRLVDDGRFYLKDEESSQKRKFFKELLQCRIL